VLGVREKTISRKGAPVPSAGAAGQAKAQKLRKGKTEIKETEREKIGKREDGGWE
jgi:hypothetical protein